jgi:hypothetical protein
VESAIKRLGVFAAPGAQATVSGSSTNDGGPKGAASAYGNAGQTQ